MIGFDYNVFAQCLLDTKRRIQVISKKIFCESLPILELIEEMYPDSPKALIRMTV